MLKGNNFNGYQHFKLKKGRHYSGFRFNPTWKKTSFRIEVLFSDECSYPSFGDADDYDINKLYGISWGMHHKNSFRIGWRSDQKGGIILSSYYYVDGERLYEDICNIPTNTNIVIDFDNGNTSISTLRDIWTSKVELNTSCKWGYTLFPYFGGNKPTPNDMEIFIKVVR